MPIVSGKLQKEIRKTVSIGYQLYLPAAYEEQMDKKWPVILFLHGIKKRGEDIHMLDHYGLGWMADKIPGFEFIVISPQCPSLSSWPMERDAVLTLLDEVIETHRVDRERIYLTGFSLGGHGAWDLAAYAPERFAATAPLAGWFDPEKAVLLKSMPIWAFHGEDDDVVEIARDRAIVDALKERGGNVVFTTYPGLQHQVMDETYGNLKLYEWMLKHTIKRM
ncbi:prolyl oligopeptidase family serine peptidase [Paenibacillus sp. NPDC056579]|uniref:carboxylesterase family protein n=1 Tax=Paenibacillus sp. NPDC056579 TaxID=3345871 RepID=UPI00368966B6